MICGTHKPPPPDRKPKNVFDENVAYELHYKKKLILFGELFLCS